MPAWFIILPLLIAAAPSTQPTLSYTFENLSALPDDILVLSGEFSIQKENTNSFLELAPSPIDSHAILLGQESSTPSSISARIFASNTGKRSPEFGVGLAGPAGYKLSLMPAVNQLQLLKNEDVLTSVPYTWPPSTWTSFHLQLTKLPTGKLQLQATAHPSDKPAPAQWMLSHTDPDEDPPKGRASLFATPYSETPTRFDDITVAPARH
ncbi:MAG: hypothetical protein NTU53_02675 [Planctomycetota bacterium]|nr:hypothetical protein [Planctomycetota bacterium]